MGGGGALTTDTTSARRQGDASVRGDAVAAWRVQIGQGEREREGLTFLRRLMVRGGRRARNIAGVGFPVIAGLRGVDDDARLDAGMKMVRSSLSEIVRGGVEVRPDSCARRRDPFPVVVVARLHEKEGEGA